MAGDVAVGSDPRRAGAFDSSARVEVEGDEAVAVDDVANAGRRREKRSRHAATARVTNAGTRNEPHNSKRRPAISSSTTNNAAVSTSIAIERQPRLRRSPRNSSSTVGATRPPDSRAISRKLVSPRRGSGPRSNSGL